MRQLLVALAWVDLRGGLLLQGTGFTRFGAFLLGRRALREVGAYGDSSSGRQRSCVCANVGFTEESIDTWRRADEADPGFVQMPRTVRLGIVILVRSEE